MKILVCNKNEKSRLVVGQLLKEMSFSVLLVDSEVLSIYDLTLNPINREVIRGGKEIVLTNKEFLLLEYFLRNKNRVLTRTMISEKIWDIDFITESNIVDVYINFLRAKVDKGFDKKIIKTVRSVGYIVKE